MKTRNAIVSIAFFLIGFQFAVAQVAVTASGGNATGSGGSVSYSIGQIDYIGYSNANGSVSQGVQQPYEFFTVSLIESESEFSCILYPNPSPDYFTLDVNQVNTTVLSYELLDVNCKLLESKSLVNEKTIISMVDYSIGYYFLTIKKNNAELKTVKIIKN